MQLSDTAAACLSASRRRHTVAQTAAAILLITAPSAKAAPGLWEVQEATSALDGQKSYIASLQSEEKVFDIIGQSDFAFLSLSCDKHGFFANVNWPDFINKRFDQFSVPVRWKLDDGLVQESDWLAGERTVGLAGERGLNWVKALSAAKKLVVQPPDQHGGQDAVFDLSGLGDIYAVLAARTCP